ncbi:hypothetical protein SmJEL517_g02013 [Synchytrium microbalum]|uniref:Uncharacterized protein n=1 Tax=Synchytrium microbalum TaxID=1806994 RepID=A0A507C851_9FUNG|nr:uncharacterized protein SmJEL517_g02013 [Synchytrium microbalum]TPX35691.1 hypothetical protein SmJEL517_g02013 [Synchytrium microbalum]
MAASEALSVFLAVVVAVPTSDNDVAPENSTAYDPLFDVFSTGRQRFTVVEAEDVVAHGQESSKTFDVNNDDLCAKALKSYIQRVIEETSAARNAKAEDPAVTTALMPAATPAADPKGGKKLDPKGAPVKESSRPPTASPSKDASKRGNKLRDRKAGRAGAKSSAIADEPSDGPDCYILLRKLRPETIKLFARDNIQKVDALVILDGMPASMGGLPKPATNLANVKHALLNEVMQLSASPEANPKWADTAICQVKISDAKDSLDAFNTMAREIYTILAQRKAFENAFKVATIEIPKIKSVNKRPLSGTGQDLASVVSAMVAEVAPLEEQDAVEIDKSGDVVRRLHQHLADRVAKMSFAPSAVVSRSSDNGLVDPASITLSKKLQQAVKSLQWKADDEKAAVLESEEFRKTTGVIGSSSMSLKRWRTEFETILGLESNSLDSYCWTERLDERATVQVLDSARLYLHHSTVTPFYGSLLASVSHSEKVNIRMDRQIRETVVPTKIGFGKFYQMYRNGTLNDVLLIKKPIYQANGLAIRHKQLIDHYYTSDGLHVAVPVGSEGTPASDERNHVDWCGIHIVLDGLRTSSPALKLAIGTVNISVSTDSGTICATAISADGKCVVVKAGVAISQSVPSIQKKNKMTLSIQDKVSEELRRTLNSDGSVMCIYADGSSTTYFPSGAICTLQGGVTSHTGFTGQRSRFEADGSVTSLPEKLRIARESHRDLHKSQITATREDLVTTTFEGNTSIVTFADGTRMESSYTCDMLAEFKRLMDGEEWPKPETCTVSQIGFATADSTVTINLDGTAVIRVERFRSAMCEMNWMQGSMRLVDSDGTTITLPTTTEPISYNYVSPKVSTTLDSLVAGTLSQTLIKQSHQVQSRMLNAPRLFLLFDNGTAIELLKDDDSARIIKEAYSNSNLEVSEEDLKDGTGAVGVNIASYAPIDGRLEWTRQLVRYPVKPHASGSHSDIIVKPSASHVPKSHIKKRIYRPAVNEGGLTKRVTTSMLVKEGIRDQLEAVESVPKFFASPEGSAIRESVAPAASL